MIRCQARVRRGTFELDVSFESGAGTIALFGPSGSGKSTVLALIAGLLRPDSGRLEIDGEPLFDTDTRLHVPPHRRRIGLVFQDALLFPHLTVRQNLLYGRRFGGHRAGRESVDAVTALLGIEHLLERRPGESVRRRTAARRDRSRRAVGSAPAPVRRTAVGTGLRAPAGDHPVHRAPSPRDGHALRVRLARGRGGGAPGGARGDARARPRDGGRRPR